MAPLRRLAAAIPLIASLALVGCASEGGGIQSQKLAMIKSRGKLICGVDGKLPGFSFVGPDGSYSGLDVDVCKATAAAVLSDPAKVDYRDLNSSERFAALASGEVDMLSRNTTYTLSRDAAGGNGLNFAPTVFYDGQGVMVPNSSGVKSLKDLAGKPICVESGTTTELNLADRMREIKAAYTPLKFQTGDQTYAAYLEGRCVAVTSDRSQLAGKRTSFPDPAAHTLLPEVLSKEPLAPATVQADPAWADAVRRDFDTDKIHLLINNAGIMRLEALDRSKSEVAKDKDFRDLVLIMMEHDTAKRVRAEELKDHPFLTKDWPPHAASHPLP